MPLNHHPRRLVASIAGAGLRDSIWISDSLLQASLARFAGLRFPSYQRHGSSVPGPLEARRRQRGRKMTSISNHGGFTGLDVDWTPVENAWEALRRRVDELSPKQRTAQLLDSAVELPQDHLAQQVGTAGSRQIPLNSTLIYARLAELSENENASRYDEDWAKLELALCTSSAGRAGRYLRTMSDTDLADVFVRYFAPKLPSLARARLKSSEIDAQSQNNELTPFARPILACRDDGDAVDAVLPDLVRFLSTCGREDTLLETLAQLSAHSVQLRRTTLQNIVFPLAARSPPLAAAVLTVLQSCDFASTKDIVQKAIKTGSVPSEQLVDMVIATASGNNPTWLLTDDVRYVRRQQKLADLVNQLAVHISHNHGISSGTGMHLLERLMLVTDLPMTTEFVDAMVKVSVTDQLSNGEHVHDGLLERIIGYVVSVKGKEAAAALYGSVMAARKSPVSVALV